MGPGLVKGRGMPVFHNLFRETGAVFVHFVSGGRTLVRDVWDGTNILHIRPAFAGFPQKSAPEKFSELFSQNPLTNSPDRCIL